MCTKIAAVAVVPETVDEIGGVSVLYEDTKYEEEVLNGVGILYFFSFLLGPSFLITILTTAYCYRNPIISIDRATPLTAAQENERKYNWAKKELTTQAQPWCLFCWEDGSEPATQSLKASHADTHRNDAGGNNSTDSTRQGLSELYQPYGLSSYSSALSPYSTA